MTPAIRIGAIALAVCFGWPGVAHAQKTDVVVLTNGDRITCEITSLQSGLLAVSTNDMGTIRIEWDKVRSVTSSRIFEVETTGGALWYGSLAAGNAREIVVVGATRTTLNQLAVFRITTIKKGFWNRLEGSINTGGSYTKSSGVGQLYGSLDVTARKPSSVWSLLIDSTTTFREDESDSGRYTGRLSYTHDLRDRWLVLAFGQVESNTDLGIDLRTTFGGGIGRNLIQSTRRVFQLVGGLSGNQEQPVEGDATTNLDLMSTVRYSALTYDYPKAETTLSLTVLPSTTDPGRVRMGARAKISRALFTNDFVFALTGFDDYDNRPPAGAVNSNDLGFTFSLGWKF